MLHSYQASFKGLPAGPFAAKAKPIDDSWTPLTIGTPAIKSEDINIGPIDWEKILSEGILN